MGQQTESSLFSHSPQPIHSPPLLHLYAIRLPFPDLSELSQAFRPFPSFTELPELYRCFAVFLVDFRTFVRLYLNDNTAKSRTQVLICIIWYYFPIIRPAFLSHFVECQTAKPYKANSGRLLPRIFNNPPGITNILPTIVHLSAGHHQCSADYRYLSVGHHQYSADYHYLSAGHRQYSADYHYLSAGHRQYSADYHYLSARHRQCSADYRYLSVGFSDNYRLLRQFLP